MRLQDVIALVLVALVVAFLRRNLFAAEDSRKSELVADGTPLFPLDVGGSGGSSSPPHHHSGCDSPGAGDPASGGSCGDFGGGHHH